MIFFYARFIDYGAVVMATVLADVKLRDAYGRRPVGTDESKLGIILFRFPQLFKYALFTIYFIVNQ